MAQVARPAVTVVAAPGAELPPDLDSLAGGAQGSPHRLRWVAGALVVGLVVAVAAHVGARQDAAQAPQLLLDADVAPVVGTALVLDRRVDRPRSEVVVTLVVRNEGRGTVHIRSARLGPLRLSSEVTVPPSSGADLRLTRSVDCTRAQAGTDPVEPLDQLRLLLAGPGPATPLALPAPALRMQLRTAGRRACGHPPLQDAVTVTAEVSERRADEVVLKVPISTDTVRPASLVWLGLGPARAWPCACPSRPESRCDCRSRCRPRAPGS